MMRVVVATSRAVGKTGRTAELVIVPVLVMVVVLAVLISSDATWVLYVSVGDGWTVPMLAVSDTTETD